MPHDLLLDAKVNQPGVTPNQDGSAESTKASSGAIRRQKRSSRHYILAETTDEGLQDLIRMSSQSRERRNRPRMQQSDSQVTLNIGTLSYRAA